VGERVAFALHTSRDPKIFRAGCPSSSPVTTPYRNEIDALRERKDSLEQELAKIKAQTHELEGLRSREHELEREIASVAQKLGANGRRVLPLLDQVRVASPCNADWNEMVGDERVRFCLSCDKNVYNLSAMPREAAEQLLQDRVGKDLCVRFYQRADGTILTEDCPVGVKKKRRKKLALSVAGAGALAAMATSMLTRGVCHTQGEMTMQGAVAEATETPMMGDVAPPNPPTPSVMGSVAPPAPEPPPVPIQGQPVKMGKRAR
jgi:hypothetical protein